MAYSDDGSSDSATTTSGGRSGTDSVIKTRAYDAMQIRECWVSCEKMGLMLTLPEARLDDSDSACKSLVFALL
jgi:hypothetical protein